jgi:hypothetical protein
MTCPDAAPALGAYVLGALEPEERRQFDEHLLRCASCSAELAEFRALPGLLDRVRPEDLQPVPVAPSPGLFDRVSAAAALDGRGQRHPQAHRPGRRRLLVAAAVVAVLGAGGGITWWAVSGGEQTWSASEGSVHMNVTVTARAGGTALDVSVAGLPPHQTCRLVVVDGDGARHQAGEWDATYAGEASFRGWTAVDQKALADLVLLGSDGEELVRVPL